MKEQEEEKKEEQQLMKLLKGDDEGAFNIIYKEYSPLLERVLKGYGIGGDDIKDILQDVFISLWCNRHKREVAGSLKKYLVGAVYKKSFTLFQRKKTNTKQHVLYEHIREILTTDKQNKRELYESLQQLIDLVVNDLERKVFNAFYENEEKIKDIAAELGIKPHKVRRILYKIHKSLRTWISK